MDDWEPGFVYNDAGEPVLFRVPHFSDEQLAVWKQAWSNAELISTINFDPDWAKPNAPDYLSITRGIALAAQEDE